MLAITSNTGQTTQLKSDAPISIFSNKKLNLIGKGNNDAADYGIILTANDTVNKSVTLKLRPHYSSAASHPFDLALGNAGNIWVDFDPTANNNQGVSNFYIGMNQQISGGLKITGSYLGLGVTPNSSEQDLRLDTSGKNNRYGAIKSDYFIATGGSENNSQGYTFGKNESISGAAGNYTYIADGFNLRDLIYDCLAAAADARQAANNAQNKADQAWDRAGDADAHAGRAEDAASRAQSTADSASSAASRAQSTADGKVSKSTFNNHKHHADYANDSFVVGWDTYNWDGHDISHITNWRGLDITIQGPDRTE